VHCPLSNRDSRCERQRAELAVLKVEAATKHELNGQKSGVVPKSEFDGFNSASATNDELNTLKSASVTRTEFERLKLTSATKDDQME
jgi:hypothetical protein